MKLDTEKYMPLLDRLEMSEAQKTEVMHTVWGIMQSYVDHAFGLHPVERYRIKKQKTLGVQSGKELESRRTS